jgi:hypothetical protein
MIITGNKSMNDAVCCGRPTIATTTQNQERAGELILQSKRMMADEPSKLLNISTLSANR